MTIQGQPAANESMPPQQLQPNESYKTVAFSNTIEVQQNDAYTLEEPVTTTANESYNYPAKLDPSNTIEAKENEAYAMSIVTEENEAYKPVTVVSVSGTSDEYDYIYLDELHACLL